MKFVLVALLFVVVVCGATAGEEEVVEEEDYEGSPCFPQSVHLIKRANEDCDQYATRVCEEARLAANNSRCSLTKCEAETKLRCPFRDITRSRANLAIKKIAQDNKIWEEAAASEWCLSWYSREISNLTRVAAVWDALRLMPCYHIEDWARNSSCFIIERESISATHPLAKFCYRSRPIELNVGVELSVECCYNEELELMTLGEKGAGSVDLVTKIGSDGTLQLDDHLKEDVLPYLACCALSDNCSKYGALRPASVVPDSAQNVTDACTLMNNVYEWAPYHKYPPPYHPLSDLYKEWDELKLSSASKIPTTVLSEVLAHASAAVDKISHGKNPYEETSTTTPSSTTPSSSTTTSAGSSYSSSTTVPVLDKILAQVIESQTKKPSN